MLTAELRALALHFAGLERRLFEVLGGWVPSVPEPEVKVALRVASFGHAATARMWESITPASAAPAAAVAVPPVLASLAEAEGTGDRLAGAYRLVVPALVTAYGRRLPAATADVAAGGPLARVLGAALAGHAAAVLEGERLLASVSPPSPGFVAALTGSLAAPPGVEPPESTG